MWSLVLGSKSLVRPRSSVLGPPSLQYGLRTKDCGRTKDYGRTKNQEPRTKDRSVRAGELGGEEHRHAAAAIVTTEDRQTVQVVVVAHAAGAGALGHVHQAAVGAGPLQNRAPRAV